MNGLASNISGTSIYDIDKISCVDIIEASHVGGVEAVVSNIILSDTFTGASLDTTKWDLVRVDPSNKLTITFTGSEMKGRGAFQTNPTAHYSAISKTRLAPASGWVIAWDVKLTATTYFQYPALRLFYDYNSSFVTTEPSVTVNHYNAYPPGHGRLHMRNAANVVIQSATSGMNHVKGTYQSQRVVWDGIDKTTLEYWNGSAWAVSTTKIDSTWLNGLSMYACVNMMATNESAADFFVKNFYLTRKTYTTQYPT